MGIEGGMAAEQEGKEPLYNLNVTRGRTGKINSGPESILGMTRTILRLETGDEEIDSTITGLLGGKYRFAVTCATDNENDPKRIDEIEWFEKKMEGAKGVLMRPEIQEKIRELIEEKQALQAACNEAELKLDKVAQEYLAQEKIRDSVATRKEIEAFMELPKEELALKLETVEKYIEEGGKVTDLWEARYAASSELTRCKKALSDWEKNVFLPYGIKLREVVDEGYGGWNQDKE